MHVRLAGVSKHFGSLTANDQITFDILPGEIHSLLGENGAGKTTLMKILYGLYRPDEGKIIIDGKPVQFRSPHDALTHGIGMVHQHFMLISTLTVAENCAIGREPLWKRWAPRHFEQSIKDDGLKYGLQVDPRALVSDLSVGEQQRAEIARTIGRGVRVLILDEPTAVLTPRESDELMNTLRKLSADGTSIVFISHKLGEVMQISDRISVLRSGKLLRTIVPQETSQRELALLMIGRQELALAKRKEGTRGDVALKVENLRVRNSQGREVLHGISFELHAGEVLGVAGVDGNGQTELTHGLVGLNASVSGSVMHGGTELVGKSAAAIADEGIGYVTEDRTHWGLFPDLPVAENLLANRHDRIPFRKYGLLQQKTIRAAAETLIREFDIRPQSPDLPINALSGGNKQKVVIARAFSRMPKVIIICQPSRGVDVGAAEYIRQRILDERSNGVAILLISADLDEILTLSDRIAIMYEGRFAAILDHRSATAERIGLLMAGVSSAADAKVESTSI